MSRPLRKAKDLRHDQLVDLVEHMQDVLYGETVVKPDRSIEFRYNPNKPWDADTLAEIGELMANHGLVPTGSEEDFSDYILDS